MREVCLRVERAAASDIRVLIVGETGTGKEVLSRALHGLSARAKIPSENAIAKIARRMMTWNRNS